MGKVNRAGVAGMELLEQYEELIERSPSDISHAWKGAAIVAYFLSSLSAYACSILFSILWADVCGGHCYLWSDIRHYDDPNGAALNATSTLKIADYDWTQEIVVAHKSQFHCNMFHFACLFSCAVGVILLMMFLICGKGGHDTSLFVAPWRLVLPALFSSLVMMIMTMTAATSFSRGYFHFSERLYLLAYRIMKRANAPFEYKRPCEVFQRFTQSHNTAEYDSCMIYWMIQMCLWTMTWSWIGGLFVLLVRILMSADFSLLKVKVYSLPRAGPERDAILKMISDGKHSIMVQHSQDPRAQAPQRRDTIKEKVL